MSNVSCTNSTGIVLRPSVLAFRIDDTLQFVLTGTGLVKTFAADDLAFRIVTELRAGIPLEELEGRVRDCNEYSPSHFADIIETLNSESLIQATDAHRLSEHAHSVDFTRYDRQLRLFADLVADGRAAPRDTAIDLQRRLAGATVVVLGVGALGGSVLAALGAAGIGTLRIVDNDNVELSNLNRQLLFSLSDVGRPKVQAAADRLIRLNADVEVQSFARHITTDSELDDIIAGADLVINCADHPNVITTSEWVSLACHRRGIRHIVGGAYAYQMGGIGLAVIPGETACWSCLRSATARDFDRDNASTLVERRGPGPAIAMVSATVGNIVAWEAVRLLTGMPGALAGRWAEIDFWSLETQFRAIPRLDDCSRCGAANHFPKG